MPITRSMVNKTNVVHIYDGNFDINNYRMNRRMIKCAQKGHTIVKNTLGFILLGFIAIYVGMLSYLTYTILPEPTQEYIRTLFVYTYAFMDQIVACLKILINYIDFVPILLMLVLLFMI